MSKKKILVADDDTQMRKLYEDFLPLFVDCEAVIKADGADALAYVEAGGRFDALVTDRQMPKLFGDALIATLRGRGFVQPMYLVTGDGGDHSACGATAVLRKPFDFSALKALFS